MSFIIYVFSAFFTAIPSILFLSASLVLYKDEYFGLTYTIVGSILLLTSLGLGLILPYLLKNRWLRRPWLWIFVQGIAAWFIGLLGLLLLNMTPLCVGQDNGDGSNGFALCIVQTVLVGMVYSPLAIILYALSALMGGWLVKCLVGKDSQGM